MNNMLIYIGLLFIIVAYICNGNSVKKNKPLQAKIHSINELKPMKSKIQGNNMILTENAQLSLEDKFDIVDNRNVYVIANSGSGKSYSIVEPSLIAIPNESDACPTKLITDVGGVLHEKYHNYFINNGYDVKVLDLFEFKKINHFNPFWYIKTINGRFIKDSIVDLNEEIDMDFIDTMLRTIIPPSDSDNEFWNSNCRELCKTLILLMCYHKKFKDQRNINTMINLFNKLFEKIGETNQLDLLFKELEAEIINPIDNETNQVKAANIVIERWNSIASQLTGDNPYSISMQGSFSTAFSPFLTANLSQLLSTDDMELERVGNKDNGKVVYFIKSNDATKNYQFLSALFINCFFQMVIFNSNKNDSKRLDRHTEILLEEAANAGYINGLDTICTTIRKRNVSLLIISQTYDSQLNNIYGEEATTTIIDNCAIKIFISSSEYSTLKEISDLSGQKIITLDSGNNSSKNKSSTTSESLHPLVSINDLNNIKKYHCYLIINDMIL